MSASARKLTFPPSKARARGVPHLLLVEDDVRQRQAVRVVATLTVSEVYEMTLVSTGGVAVAPNDGHELADRAARRAAFESSRATWLEQPLIDANFNEESLYDEQGLPK